MLRRLLQEQIENHFFRKRCIIIYGARRVGKTTLIKQIQKKYSESETFYLNCDEPDIRADLTDATSTELKALIGKRKIIFIDEAQRVKNIGLTLKLLVDNFPNKQIVATGSSSLDMANEIVEPLTGRKYEFQLFPFSLLELTQKFSPIEMNRLLETRIIFGMYPEIVERSDEAEVLLRELSSSYLYKDVLQYQNIRKPEMLEKLLVALALQVGNEVSYNELGNLLGTSKETIINYIQLLEKSFVIFRLPPYSRNLRSELTKMRKIYFYDTGIRNCLINNFNPLDRRQDVGQLWENFIIAERLKYLKNKGSFVNSYFWRTHQQQEIDYLEEADGKLAGFEIKWSAKKRKIPKKFIEAYPDSQVKFVTRDNFGEFVGI